jgi:hypothetical protein
MKTLLYAALLLATVPAALAESPKLADLSWFAGRWVDDSGGDLSEEIWTAPAGDSMVGMWRYVSGGKVKIYEILTISSEEGGIVLRLRHFDPKLVGREDKATPVALKLTGWKPGEARFEGPAVGAPGTLALTYRRSGDALMSTLEKDGRKQEFSFRKVAP